MSLTDALKTLSDAHGPRALVAAFNTLQGQVRRARKASANELGTLAQTFTAAMRIWDAQKAEGVSKAERLEGLEKTLRVAWPQAREWKYLCAECGDLGLVYYECGGGSECGRIKKHLPHTYGRPCFCAKGAKFAEKPKPQAEDFKAAGKMVKVGR